MQSKFSLRIARLSNSLWVVLAILFIFVKSASAIGDEDLSPIDEAPAPEVPDLDTPDASTPDDSNPVTEEIFSSWSLFIVLFLLGSALWSSYYLQQRRIKAIHETVLSIFYSPKILDTGPYLWTRQIEIWNLGLIIRVSPGHYIQDAVKFNSNYFFNILLPPIILNSGYELNQANFFRNIGSILTFAIPGTFISAIVVGIILFLYTRLGLESINISFVDSLAVGATLSATDPVTILSIFNSYKVDPKLYTIIFGESLLNDAICIVMFETCAKFHGQQAQFSSLFQGIALFLITFTVSTFIGLASGVLIALMLKHSHIRRYPQIESCLVLLLAYESYFFSNGCHMSGIVSLLFCGITLKHYAYYNMSRRTQVATKYTFQLLAQLSENFIFIYLGLSLFTEVELVFKPLLIIVTFVCICIARWAAVFPLSRLINWFTRTRRAKSGYNHDITSTEDEIPYNYQMMQFWAGLRGAVGVALAMGLQGDSKYALLATVLVVVVLTVILFGGTTAAMLEILNIKTGCVDENEDNDDDFDIETPAIQRISSVTGRHYKKPSTLSSPYFDESRFSSTRSKHPSQEDFVSGSDMDSQIEIPPPSQNLASFPSRGHSVASLHGSQDNSFTQQSKSTFGAKPTASVLNLSNLLNVEEPTKWFSSFDENVLKPVLLDNINPGDSTIHEESNGSTTNKDDVD